MLANNLKDSLISEKTNDNGLILDPTCTPTPTPTLTPKPWGTPMGLTSNSFDDYCSVVAIDSNGIAHVVYHEVVSLTVTPHNGDKEVYYTQADLTTPTPVWATPVCLTDLTPNSTGYDPSIAIDSNDDIHLVYIQGNVGQEQNVLKYLKGTNVVNTPVSWSNETTISFDRPTPNAQSHVQHPEIVHFDGQLYAVWSQHEANIWMGYNHEIYFNRTVGTPQAWQTPTQLTFTDTTKCDPPNEWPKQRWLEWHPHIALVNSLSGTELHLVYETEVKVLYPPNTPTPTGTPNCPYLPGRYIWYKKGSLPVITPVVTFTPHRSDWINITPTPLSSHGHDHVPQIIISSGRHVVWRQHEEDSDTNRGVYYRKHTLGSGWSTAWRITGPDIDTSNASNEYNGAQFTFDRPEISLDRDGNGDLHLTYVGGDWDPDTAPADDAVFYTSGSSTSSPTDWSNPFRVSLDEGYKQHLDIECLSSNDKPQMVYDQGPYSLVYYWNIFFNRQL